MHYKSKIHFLSIINCSICSHTYLYTDNKQGVDNLKVNKVYIFCVLFCITITDERKLVAVRVSVKQNKTKKLIDSLFLEHNCYLSLLSTAVTFIPYCK